MELNKDQSTKKQDPHENQHTHPIYFYIIKSIAFTKIPDIMHSILLNDGA